MNGHQHQHSRQGRTLDDLFRRMRDRSGPVRMPSGVPKEERAPALRAYVHALAGDLLPLDSGELEALRHDVQGLPVCECGNEACLEPALKQMCIEMIDAVSRFQDALAVRAAQFAAYGGPPPVIIVETQKTPY